MARILSPGKARIGLDRADLGIGATIIVLLVAIVGVIAAGDRAGVGVSTMLPSGEAHTTTPIRIVFSETMDAATVESRFAIDPPIVGKFAWNGQQLTFKPSVALAADQVYTVTVLAGATSTQGRRLLSDVHWSFNVGRPRVAYLAPAVRDQQAEPANVWIADPAAPFAVRQLTTSEYGVIDFEPSPDGTQIAFAQSTPGGGADLYVVPVDGGAAQQVTNCLKALCQAPDWSPDGLRIAYERIELNKDLPQVDQGVPRTWIVNLKDLSTAPLLSDTQALGRLPRWSPDGTQIAVYDLNLHGIAIYDLANGDRKFISTYVEETGAFDPTGARLVYPELVQSPFEFFNAFAVADLANPANGIKPLNGQDTTPVSDHQAAWTPDGKALAITRRYNERRLTCDPQIYLISAESAEVQPLVVDANYAHGAIGWNPAGDQLVMQRYPCTDPNGQPGIWIYDMKSKSLRQVAKNGYIPQWVP
jgi:Tol biopolymer transport system component